MLLELSIKNFAIIESLTVSFETGMTVLTGETGAGKSIIIDAIFLLTGGRGSIEFVRHGEKRAEIEGLLSLEDDDHPCYNIAQQMGIDITDGMIILRREILASGKSVCRINGKLVTIAILREIGRTLVDIHGQHEHQELLHSDLHLSLLDEFGGEEVKAAIHEYGQLYKSYKELSKKVEDLSTNEQQMAQRLDLLKFQLHEIQNANLQPGEDESLAQEKREISNFEKLHHGLEAAVMSLKGEQKGLDWLGLALTHVEGLTTLRDDLKGVYDSLASNFYIIEDMAHELQGALDSLEYDQGRLNFIEGRLHEISRLKKKYGVSVNDIIEYGAEIEEEIEKIDNKDSILTSYAKQLDGIKEDVLVEAENLSAIRKKYADKLTTVIMQELKELYMEKTKFTIEFESLGVNFQKNGIDGVEFYISTNPGEPPKQLTKIASGGELSRIMLAMKSIFSRHQGVTSIIFDEVDTGVSGRVAQAIAEKMFRLSIGSQVLCISHLPQVAAMADTHLYITKSERNGRTITDVSILSEDEKVKEIARMISGVEITDLTMQHARELLEMADSMKQINV
ncbi:DNA repair protein RecN [Bacillus sp. HMF5848]|uniref:DNA repair protein RecN n=1 Tax=Bacillus sp. HMF5848 TaxID=2495421 RepID=UPI000F7668D0|nr:DNA repair protein RecN [Bacillus sp. HMF5848]RSK27786.1 DNA repair protein RecN [Bacillus sp. HMF5848]